MSEPKFTPGEWIFDGNTIETKDKRICIVGSLGCSPEEDEDNGALISAAPAMYEMLSDYYHSCGDCATWEWWEKLEKLLRKARGE